MSETGLLCTKCYRESTKIQEGTGLCPVCVAKEPPRFLASLSTTTTIRPDYYKEQGIEVFDVINAFGLDFYEGNVIKYVCRAGKKGNYLEDLVKARTYLDYLIEMKKEGKA